MEAIHIKGNFMLWFLFLKIQDFLPQAIGRAEGCSPCELLTDTSSIGPGCFRYITSLFRVLSTKYICISRKSGFSVSGIGLKQNDYNYR